MKYMTSALLIAGLTLGPLSAGKLHAEKDQEEDMDDSGKSQRQENMLKKLGLSGDPAEKMKAAMKAHRDAVKPLRKDARADMKKLRDQIKNKANDAAVAATLAKMEISHKAIQAENEKLKAATDSLLTPTQRAKLLLKMMKRMHGGPGQGGGRRGPGDKDGDED